MINITKTKKTIHLFSKLKFVILTVLLLFEPFFNATPYKHKFKPAVLTILSGI